MVGSGQFVGLGGVRENAQNEVPDAWDQIATSMIASHARKSDRVRKSLTHGIGQHVDAQEQLPLLQPYRGNGNAQDSEPRRVCRPRLSLSWHPRLNIEAQPREFSCLRQLEVVLGLGIFSTGYWIAGCP